MTVQVDLQKALEMVPNKNKLIILISKRVKQLSHGAQPLIKAERGDDFISIAIKEVVESKIWYQEPKEQ
jgi:DNA-directed RNA polymerase omega subunit